jgi:tetratricopeptide (TPR) repeat protein
MNARRRARLDTHFALCAACRRLAQAAAEMLNLGVGSEELRDQIAEAENVVRQLEASSSPRLDALAACEEWGTNRFVAGGLLERSRKHFNGDPIKALRLARAAAEIGTRISSAEVQFESWRDCISIYARLGRYGYAFDAIERAEQLASLVADREHAKGLVLYARAYVSCNPDVWHLGEALTAAHEAEQIFARVDASRIRDVAELRAKIHELRGEHAAAVEIYRHLWNGERSASLAVNFGWCLVSNDQPELAAELIMWAAPRIDKADTVLLARLAWLEGRAHAKRSRWEEARSSFSLASERYRSVPMIDSAIRVDLRRIGATVNADRDALGVYQNALNDLRDLVLESSELDRREPTRRRRFTVEALEYAKQLGDAAVLTPDLLTYVAEYLDSLWRGPARALVRPVPARLM